MNMNSPFHCCGVGGWLRLPPPAILLFLQSRVLQRRLLQGRVYQSRVLQSRVQSHDEDIRSRVHSTNGNIKHMRRKGVGLTGQGGAYGGGPVCHTIHDLS